MKQISTHRKVALIGALIAALSLAGAAMAGTPQSSQASPTAVTHAAASSSTDTDANANDGTTSDAHGSTVSTAAQSSLTGGPHNNHGGYVSCVARGGSSCDTTNQTLPSHGKSSSHIPASVPSH